MPTLADLQAQRDKLAGLRASGVRVFRDQNGESVQYATDAEMAAALADLDRQIAGQRHPSTIIFRTKGY